jgi:hypothetical protein
MNDNPLRAVQSHYPSRTLQSFQSSLSLSVNPAVVFSRIGFTFGIAFIFCQDIGRGIIAKQAVIRVTPPRWSGMTLDSSELSELLQFLVMGDGNVHKSWRLWCQETEGTGFLTVRIIILS